LSKMEYLKEKPIAILVPEPWVRRRQQIVPWLEQRFDCAICPRSQENPVWS
jgi:hypothetical protein